MRIPIKSQIALVARAFVVKVWCNWLCVTYAYVGIDYTYIESSAIKEIAFSFKRIRTLMSDCITLYQKIKLVQLYKYTYFVNIYTTASFALLKIVWINVFNRMSPHIFYAKHVLSKILRQQVINCNSINLRYPYVPKIIKSVSAYNLIFFFCIFLNR